MPHRRCSLCLLEFYHDKIHRLLRGISSSQKISGTTLIFREPCTCPHCSVFPKGKTFARCFDKSLAARLRCSSDLLGVGGAARSLFPKNIGCNPHFSGTLYMSALLSFSERKTFARCFEKSLAARLRCLSDLLGVGGAARSLFPKNFG